MATNPFGHIDLRVADMERALPFYAQLLPALGLTREHHGPVWKVFARDEPLPACSYFGLTEERGHVANANRIAFWVASREEVDRLGAVIREAGGRDISGPRACPEYSSSYYAVFFEDPCGNRLEVYFRED